MRKLRGKQADIWRGWGGAEGSGQAKQVEGLGTPAGRHSVTICMLLKPRLILPLSLTGLGAWEEFNDDLGKEQRKLNFLFKWRRQGSQRFIEGCVWGSRTVLCPISIYQIN